MHVPALGVVVLFVWMLYMDSEQFESLPRKRPINIGKYISTYILHLSTYPMSVLRFTFWDNVTRRLLKLYFISRLDWVVYSAEHKAKGLALNCINGVYIYKYIYISIEIWIW